MRSKSKCKYVCEKCVHKNPCVMSYVLLMYLCVNVILALCQICGGINTQWLRHLRTYTRAFFVFLSALFMFVTREGLFRWVNTLRPRQNGRRFADDTFKRIFLNENVRISIKISFKFVPKGQINNIPALVQIMAWRRPGDKPLSEPMVVGLQTHICVTRPQWVNYMGRYGF